jgi:hypothetical protein
MNVEQSRPVVAENRRSASTLGRGQRTEAGARPARPSGVIPRNASHGAADSIYV